MDCWKKVRYFQYFVLSKNFLINEITIIYVDSKNTGKSRLLDLVYSIEYWEIKQKHKTHTKLKTEI